MFKNATTSLATGRGVLQIQENDTWVNRDFKDLWVILDARVDRHRVTEVTGTRLTVTYHTPQRLYWLKQEDWEQLRASGFPVDQGWEQGFVCLTMQLDLIKKTTSFHKRLCQWDNHRSHPMSKHKVIWWKILMLTTMLVSNPPSKQLVALLTWFCPLKLEAPTKPSFRPQQLDVMVTATQSQIQVLADEQRLELSLVTLCSSKMLTAQRLSISATVKNLSAGISCFFCRKSFFSFENLSNKNTLRTSKN